MLDRRDFLRSSVIAATAFAAGKIWASPATRQPLGIQLYTLRDQADKDLPGVLKAIHEIGYEEVELYWSVYRQPAEQLRRMLDDHGLRAPSGHFDYDGLESKLDYAKSLGLSYVICPMLPKEMWNSAESFQKAAEQFNRWGEMAQQRGLKFGFHNHNYEFHKFGDTTGFDILLQRMDPKLVCLEMDCYWMTQAGRDPVQMLRRHGKRIRMLHLKDRKPGFPPSQEMNAAAEHFTEVGSGAIDWKTILAAAKEAGIEHMFVERDSGDRAAMDSARISYQNLQKML